MKVLNHLFVAGLIVAASVSAQADKVVGKIVGGTEASINEFPYIVSLQSSSHFCGGSLIKKNWVLTAAHCVKGGTVKNVVIGLHDLKNATNAEVIAPKRIIAHPKYNASTTDFDFALIELSKDSSHTPVALNTTEIAISDSGTPIMSTVAGWGTTSEGSYSLPNLLQRVDVPLVSATSCAKSYPKITDRMICAGYTDGGKDSCQGDSGGPLVAKADDGQTYLIGIVSWGRGCARAGYPGVYSKVNAGYDWIMENSK